MNKTKKKNRKKVDTVKSVNNSIRTSVRKLNPILKSIVGKKVDVAMSNTFGFGGHNACVLFKRFQD